MLEMFVVAGSARTGGVGGVSWVRGDGSVCLHRVRQHPPHNVPGMLARAGRERLPVTLARRLADKASAELLAVRRRDGRDRSRPELIEYIAPQQPLVLVAGGL